MTWRKRPRQSARPNAKRPALLPMMIDGGSLIFTMAAGDPPDTRMIAFFAMDKSPLCALCG